MLFGVMLFGGFIISVCKVYGCNFDGMICLVVEFNLGVDYFGILVLFFGVVEFGVDGVGVLGFDDVVFYLVIILDCGYCMLVCGLVCEFVCVYDLDFVDFVSNLWVLLLFIEGLVWLLMV